MRHRSRFLGALLAVSVALTGIAAGVVSAPPVSATSSTDTRSAPTELTGTTSLSRLGLTALAVDGVATTATVDTTLAWNQAATVKTTFDPDAVRQGGALDPVDSFSRRAPGSMVLNWSLNDLKVGWGLVGPIDIGTVGLSAVGTCDLRAGGPAYACHFESDDAIVADTNPDPGIYVKAKLSADLTITPQGIATLRQASLGGNPAGSANLSLGESPVVDAFRISCGAGVGDDVSYTLGALSTTPGISVKTDLVVKVGTSIANPAFPATDPFNPVLYQAPIATATFPAQATTGSVPMTGNGATFDLGTVHESDLPPVAAPGGPYVGTEGAPITFDGSASGGGCGPAAPSLHWEFSDGGTAEGTMPQYTFADDGNYTGQLTATDANGNTATTAFTVKVANVAPTADAGPDATTDWGRSVAFAGQATDPGSVDQSSLQYTWHFGDGSADANGPNVSHTYANPSVGGSYDATLTVCDKDTGCASDVRQVFVTKRDTTTTYEGDTTGTPSNLATLRASLVDEYGQPVNGRTVRFRVGPDGPFNVATNSSGIATRSYRPTLAPGSYSGSSTFTGDALYNASSASSTFKVVKQSALIYYGDFIGRANKTVDLRALLIDRSGNPLPGKTVTFELGTQTATATTDVHGVATTSLRPNQRGGLYALTATWTPTGVDATTYAGSSMTVPFLLLPR